MTPYNEGYQAAKQNDSILNNPYEPYHIPWLLWNDGYIGYSLKHKN